MDNTPAQAVSALQKQIEAATPVADVAHRLMAYGFADDLIGPLAEAHRTGPRPRSISAADFHDWILTALTEAQGSGRQVFNDDRALERSRTGSLSAYYRRLAGQPPALSRALLRDVTARLRELWPDDAPPMNPAPACFDAFRLVVLDGKKVKRAGKRAKPLRGFAGSLLAAKALVATEVETGLAIAMSTALDGETNDVPLTADLMPQLHALIGDAVLYLADRQFGNKTVFDQLAEREGDAYVVRVGKVFTFTPDADHPHNQGDSVEGRCPEDRPYRDEIGTLGQGKSAIRVRRIFLDRGGKDDVVLVTNLTDAGAYPAAALLELYRCRWGIENVFQDVTETFGLEKLIGSTPEAALFQLSLCLSIYNMHQVMRAHVAVAGAAADGLGSIRDVSGPGLHLRLVRELHTWLVMLGGLPVPESPEAGLGDRLAAMGRGVWGPHLRAKRDRKGYVRPAKREFKVHGGHTSAERLRRLPEAELEKARRTGRLRAAVLKKER